MITDPTTWYTIAFVIFFALLGRTLWRMSNQLLDERIVSIGKDLKDSARIKKEAEDLLANAKQKQNEAQDRGRQIRALAEREIQRVLHDAIQERKDFLNSQEKQLTERLENLEAATFKELNEMLIQTAITSAEKVMEKNMDQKLDSALIQDTITTAESLRIPLAS